MNTLDFCGIYTHLESGCDSESALDDRPTAEEFLSVKNERRGISVFMYLKFVRNVWK